MVAQARQTNALPFAPWSQEEEKELKSRHDAGKTIEAIARADKRSPRAIELRLEHIGVLTSTMK